MKRLKEGVSVSGLRPEILLAWDIADQVYEDYGVDECWLTSGQDSRHKWGSLHFVGLAIDLRTRNIPDNTLKGSITIMTRKHLGKQYDVVLESDHLHIEFQPKNL